MAHRRLYSGSYLIVQQGMVHSYEKVYEILESKRIFRDFYRFLLKKRIFSKDLRDFYGMIATPLVLQYQGFKRFFLLLHSTERALALILVDLHQLHKFL